MAWWELHFCLESLPDSNNSVACCASCCWLKVLVDAVRLLGRGGQRAKFKKGDSSTVMGENQAKGGIAAPILSFQHCNWRGSTLSGHHRNKTNTAERSSSKTSPQSPLLLFLQHQAKVEFHIQVILSNQSSVLRSRYIMSSTQDNDNKAAKAAPETFADKLFGSRTVPRAQPRAEPRDFIDSLEDSKAVDSKPSPKPSSTTLSFTGKRHSSP